MYLWKCWYDSRTRFLVWSAFLTILTVILAYAAIGAHVPLSIAHPVLDQTPSPEIQAAISRKLMRLANPAIVLTALAALFLGSGIFAEEFRSGTIQMLLTRPRQRRHFIWTSWAFGLLQSLAVLAIIVMAGMATAFFCTHMVATQLLVLLPFVIPFVATVYGLTHTLSVLLKNGRAAFCVVFGLLVLRRLALNTVENRWHLTLPWWTFDSLPSLTVIPAPLQAHPLHQLLLAVAGWTGFALIFPMIAQLLIERREV